eukprot:10758228-Lingulodinium_polyedra.AAC.1
MVRAAGERAAAAGRSFAAVFLDLVAAYYSAVRELAMPVRSAARDVDAVVDSLQIDLATETILRAALAHPDALTRAEAPPHLAKQVAAAYEGSWFG